MIADNINCLRQQFDKLKDYFRCIHFVSCVVTLRLRYALRDCHRFELSGTITKSALTLPSITDDKATKNRN
jgi:hypothetical protein